MNDSLVNAWCCSRMTSIRPKTLGPFFWNIFCNKLQHNSLVKYGRIALYYPTTKHIWNLWWHIIQHIFLTTWYFTLLQYFTAPHCLPIGCCIFLMFITLLLNNLIYFYWFNLVYTPIHIYHLRKCSNYTSIWLISSLMKKIWPLCVWKFWNLMTSHPTKVTLQHYHLGTPVSVWNFILVL